MKEHPFVETIGLGPYTYVGMFIIDKAAGAQGRPYYDPNAMHSNFKSGCGTCAHCGTGIANVYQIMTANGDVYGIGSDCIEKCNLPYNVLSQVQKDKKRHDSKIRIDRNHKKWLALKEELKALVDEKGEELTLKPHPMITGKTVKDYADYALQNGSNTMLNNVLKYIKNGSFI